jgi:tetratricopeptide (TPR) repeat protein
MRVCFEQILGKVGLVGVFVLGVCLIAGVRGLAEEKSGLLSPDTISVERAKMLGYVENHIAVKFAPMMRRTIEWGEVKKNNKNQLTIRYQCEAIVAERNECLVYCWDFTFDAVGNFVSFNKVSGFPKRPAKPFVITVDPAVLNAPAKKVVKENAPEVKVSAQDAKDAAIAYKKALELEKKEDFAAAEVQFKEAHKKNPNNYLALLGAGNALFKQHHNVEAQKIFMQCIDMRPNDAKPLEALGLVAQAEGDEEKMIEWWKKGVELDKQAATALKGLAEYYAQKEDNKTAAMYYRMYLRTNEKDKDAKRILERLTKPKP